MLTVSIHNGKEFVAVKEDKRVKSIDSAIAYTTKKFADGLVKVDVWTKNKVYGICSPDNTVYMNNGKVC
jgi:uncharacterized protein YlzI (FlbEa/FlbD family)